MGFKRKGGSTSLIVDSGFAESRYQPSNLNYLLITPHIIRGSCQLQSFFAMPVVTSFMTYRFGTNGGVAVERLEARQLLAADAWSLRVNFQPEAIEPPPGYRYDYGAKYEQRGNGLTYGWNRDKRAGAEVVKSVFDNVRGDTRIDMNEGDTWSAAVPSDGWYSVRVLMGDPNKLDGDYRLRAEGQWLAKGKPYDADHPFVEGIETIHVTDGNLTLAGDSAAKLNRIASVKITQVDPPTAYRQGANIDWSRTRFGSPIARVEASAVRLGNRMYVFGGFTNPDYTQITQRVDVLDLNTLKWGRRDNMPAPATHTGAATDGRFIYLAGGQTGPLLTRTGTDQVWRYDPINDTWQRFGKLPAIRFGALMANLNGKLHLMGGDDESRVTSQATHWVLDLANPAAGWTDAAPLPEATDHHSVIVVNDHLYVVGGEFDHGTSYLVSRSLYEYVERIDGWNKLADQPVAASHAEANTVTDGKRIFVLAGQGAAQQIIADVRSYNIATGEWEVHSSLPTGRKGGISWIDGNRLYYLNGDDNRNGQPTWGYVGVIG